jgi:hypothetical protein
VSLSIQGREGDRASWQEHKQIGVGSWELGVKIKY